MASDNKYHTIKRLSLLVLCIIFSFVGFGQIIYQDFVPNIHLEIDTTASNSNELVNLDLNKDSINDIQLTLGYWKPIAYGHMFMAEFKPLYYGHKCAQKLGYGLYCDVLPINTGVQIWNSLDWVGGFEQDLIFFRCDIENCNGFTEYRYIGVRLELNGLHHFGWIRIKGGWSLSTLTGNLYIADCAFNSTPEAGILAGDTVTSLIVSDGENNMEKELKIYPNPVNNILFVENAEKYKRLTITDMYGRVVLKRKKLTVSENIACDDFSAGIYFIRLENSSKVVTRKVIIQ